MKHSTSTFNADSVGKTTSHDNPYLRERVDYRRFDLHLFKYHLYSTETVEQKASRMGTGDPTLVKTVFIRRKDGLDVELPRFYDRRYVDYDGVPTSRHPVIRERVRNGVLPTVPLEYLSYSNGSSSTIPASTCPFRAGAHSAGDKTLFPKLFAAQVFLERNSLSPLCRDCSWCQTDQIPSTSGFNDSLDATFIRRISCLDPSLLIADDDLGEGDLPEYIY